MSAVVESERSDGTEAIALVAPMFLPNGSKYVDIFMIQLIFVTEKNICGVSAALAFCSVFKDLRFWARDVVVVFPLNGVEGVHEWLRAYETGKSFEPAYRPGSIQSALCLEFEGLYCDTGLDFYSVHIEGPNGLLPNLDLINTLMKIGEIRHVSPLIDGNLFGSSIFLKKYPYFAKLLNIASMIWRQGFGFPRNTSGHFLNYRIDAVTIKATESKRRENDDFHRFKFKSLYEYIHIYRLS